MYVCMCVFVLVIYGTGSVFREIYVASNGIQLILYWFSGTFQKKIHSVKEFYYQNWKKSDISCKMYNLDAFSKVW